MPTSISGTIGQLAVKIFGADYDVLTQKANGDRADRWADGFNTDHSGAFANALCAHVWIFQQVKISLWRGASELRRDRPGRS